MKKLLASILILCFCASAFTVCAQAASAEEDAGASDEVITILFGHDNNPGDPVQEAAEFWAEKLDEVSGGTMKLEIYPSGSLGSKAELIDQMLMGDPVVAIGSGPFYADRGAPDLGILEAPYLFESWEQLDKLMDSDWWEEQKVILEDNGLCILADNWRYGVRHTITTKPVEHVEDLKGMKIRTQNSTVHVLGFECLGAVPTPMALTEVYTSLAQGTIEGLENPLSVIYSGKYYEVAKYLMLDGHIRNLTSICIGADFFRSLTEQQQTWLIDTATEAGLYQNELAEKADEECLALLEDEGVTVTEVDPAEFKEAAASFYEFDEIKDSWSDGLYERIEDIIS